MPKNNHDNQINWARTLPQIEKPFDELVHTLPTLVIQWAITSMQLELLRRTGENPHMMNCTKAAIENLRKKLYDKLL